MMAKTHFAIGVAIALFFLPKVTHKWIFVPLVLLASILPDIDLGASKFGNFILFRPIQWFFGHRGFLHSYTFCILVSILLAFFWPIAALPFFFGYSFHLLADTFTKEGIEPFWPVKVRSTGLISTGGASEGIVFSVFVILDALLFLSYLF